MAQSTLLKMLCIIFFLMLLYVNADPLTFHTELSCPPTNHGPEGFCAEGYYYDEDGDFYKGNDPLHFFKRCTRTGLINVTAISNPGGDGWLGAFQSNYEIALRFFHNCDPDYNATAVEIRQEERCFSVWHNGWFHKPTAGSQKMTIRLNLAEHYNDKFFLGTGHQYPKAFQNTMAEYGREFYSKGCSWNERQDQTWTIQKHPYNY